MSLWRSEQGRQAAADAITQHEAQADPHDQYVQKVSGKGLSTEDYTTEEKDTLAALERKQLVEAIRKTATLDLDFAAGEYSADDGEKLRTTDVSEVLTVQRASPKWVVGPNGKLREVPPDTLARAWKDGKCQGALIEESRTNLLRWSEDFTQGVWGSPAQTEVSKESDPAGVFGHEVSVIETVETGRVYVDQDTPMSESAVTFSVYVLFNSPDQEVYIRATGVGGSNPFVTFTGWDGTNLSVSVDSGIDSAGYEPLSGGWVRVWASYEVSGGRNDQFRFGILSDELGEKLYCTGAQLEQGPTPSSYIPTEDAPVTRAADQVGRTLGGEFNASEGRIIAHAAAPEGDDVLTLGTESIVSTSDEMTEYELNYDSDPDATDLVLGEGVIKSVIYSPGGQHD